MNSTKDFIFRGSRSSTSPGGNHEVQYLALVIADQVKLEPVEPSQGTFSSLSNPFEYLVHVYPLIAAYSQKRAVNKTDACTLAKQTFLDENNKRHNHGFFQLRKSVVGHSPGKEMPVPDAYFLKVEMFEALVVRTVEHYHDDDDFCIRHAVRPMIVALSVRINAH